MVVFITSIRHPRNSNSYDRVLDLLTKTLRSVCGQTDDRFEVVVVCNEVPQLEFTHPGITYLKTDFPPPSELNDACIGMDALRLDRGCKYLAGLLYSQRFHPDFVMWFDADDYVSNRITEFANQRTGANGWYMKEGYVYDEEMDLLATAGDFHLLCGTSHIMRFDSLELPSGCSAESSQDDILRATDHDYLFRIIGSHRWIRDYFEQKQTPLEVLPFPGAIYLIGNGENHTSRLVSCALWTGGVEQLNQIERTHLNSLQEEFTFRAPGA